MCNLTEPHLEFFVVLLTTTTAPLSDGTNGREELPTTARWLLIPPPTQGGVPSFLGPLVWKTGMDGTNADAKWLCWWEMKRRRRRMMVEGVVVVTV